ncbi:uncharacterized protein LOC143276387 isoform X2 [Babylonia areolata]|uniref:uncharacterized protein LOC143276387 isoform X2 n=1 Tax=Babylonia areolata TaxID=304850 RepID=UPI003FD2F3BE
MPLKLPSFLKSVAPGRQKAGRKHVTKHGGSKSGGGGVGSDELKHSLTTQDVATGSMASGQELKPLNGSPTEVEQKPCTGAYRCGTTGATETAPLQSAHGTDRKRVEATRPVPGPTHSVREPNSEIMEAKPLPERTRGDSEPTSTPTESASVLKTTHSLYEPDSQRSRAAVQSVVSASPGEERFSLEIHSPETLRQISGTSDYRSLSLTSTSPEPPPPFQRETGTGNAASAVARASEAEGFPDLLRSLENVDLPSMSSASEAFYSSDSGVQEECPTVIERKRAPATSPSEKARTSRVVQRGTSSGGCVQSTSSSVMSGGGGGGGCGVGGERVSPPVLLKDLASGLSSSATVPVRAARSSTPDSGISSKPPTSTSSSSSSVTAPVTHNEAQEVAARVAARAACLKPAFSSPVAVAPADADLDKEMFPQTALQTPIAALRKSRKRLCLMLNIEQIPVDSEWSPDYMGLADMLGFDAVEIQNFWVQNPTETLLTEWARSRGDPRLLPPVLDTLLQCLERLGRRDVLMECHGLILEDVSDYVAEQRLLEGYTARAD